MSGMRLLQEVPNVRWVKKTVEQKLKDQWRVTWHHNLETKSLCSNYKLFYRFWYGTVFKKANKR